MVWPEAVTINNTAVTVTMPVYNEDDIIADSIHSLDRTLNELFSEYELLVVENGSTDKTSQILRNYEQSMDQLTVIRLPEADFNQAVITGLYNASHRYVYTVQADYWQKDFLDEAMHIMNTDSPAIVQGSRSSAKADDKRPWYRTCITNILNNMLYILFGYTGTDTHANKLLDTKKLNDIINQCVLTSGGLLETEINIRAAQNNLSIIERPQNAQEQRPSRYNVIIASVREFYELMYLRLQLWLE